MRCGDYFIEFDKTGFPLVRKMDWDYAISLFPVSKYQFERFMATEGPIGDLFTDNWYRQLLDLNPRGSWRNCEERPWELFLTGVDKRGIAPFLKFLGKRFRLPLVKELKGLINASKEIQAMALMLEKKISSGWAKPENLWLKKKLFPLVEEGFLELVQDGNKLCCVGKPFQELLPNTWDPRVVRDVDWELCRKAIGFRVVKMDIGYSSKDTCIEILDS